MLRWGWRRSSHFIFGSTRQWGVFLSLDITDERMPCFSEKPPRSQSRPLIVAAAHPDRGRAKLCSFWMSVSRRDACVSMMPVSLQAMYLAVSLCSMRVAGLGQPEEVRPTKDNCAGKHLQKHLPFCCMYASPLHEQQLASSPPCAVVAMSESHAVH